MNQFEVKFNNHWSTLISSYPILSSIKKTMQTTLHTIVERVEQGGKIFICGNGGSAADAEHIAGELLKSFKLPRPLTPLFKEALIKTDSDYGTLLANNLQAGIPTFVLSNHVSLSTAFANDVDPYMAYAQQLHVLGSSKDIFIGISTSGNAKNVNMAAVVSRAKNMFTIGLTGENGGNLAQHSDICLKVPHYETYKIQELHQPLYHMMCLLIEDYFWGEESLMQLD